jgi:hypothetical protein
MSDSDSGGSSSTRLSAFKGGVNSYPHYRIKLISLFSKKGPYFLIARDSHLTPHCLWEKNMKGSISPLRTI